MKTIARFLFAGLVALIVVVTSSQVWASPRFAGTIPTNPPIGTTPPLATSEPTPVPGIPVTGDKGATVNMGPAALTPLDPNVSLVVTRQFLDQITQPPAGLVFTSDAFQITASQVDALVEVCFAFPPEYVTKGVKMNKLNNSLTPPVWEEITETELVGGQLCATPSVPGGGLMVTLLGKP